MKLGPNTESLSMGYEIGQISRLNKLGAKGPRPKISSPPIS